MKLKNNYFSQNSWRGHRPFNQSKNYNHTIYQTPSLSIYNHFLIHGCLPKCFREMIEDSINRLFEKVSRSSLTWILIFQNTLSQKLCYLIDILNNKNNGMDSQNTPETGFEKCFCHKELGSVFFNRGK